MKLEILWVHCLVDLKVLKMVH
jgi:hypothetical protein